MKKMITVNISEYKKRKVRAVCEKLLECSEEIAEALDGTSYRDDIANLAGEIADTFKVSLRLPSQKKL